MPKQEALFGHRGQAAGVGFSFANPAGGLHKMAWPQPEVRGFGGQSEILGPNSS